MLFQQISSAHHAVSSVFRLLLQILEAKTPFDEEPVFMYLAHQAVHDPLGLPPADSFTEEQMGVLDAIEANSDDDDAHLRKRFAKVKRGRTTNMNKMQERSKQILSPTEICCL